jgi:hypothetical protein
MGAGLLTDRAPAFSRYSLRRICRAASIIFHALPGAALLFSTLLVMRYLYKRGSAGETQDRELR